MIFARCKNETWLIYWYICYLRNVAIKIEYFIILFCKCQYQLFEMNRGYPSSFYQSQRPWLINIIILVWLPAPTCQLLLSDNSQTKVTQWLTSLCNGCNVLSDSCGYLSKESKEELNNENFSPWFTEILFFNTLTGCFKKMHLKDACDF